MPIPAPNLPFLPLLASLCLATVPCLAQDAPQAGENEPDDPSRETDISEDNYRRFMELDDRQLERPAFPAATIKPGSTLEKMGRLPEESQKHLRNQLRGIILQRGPWSPAERNRDYPFVPSPAARRDGELMRREAEAWAELVGEYHDREAAILAGRQGDTPTGTGERRAGMPPGATPDGATQRGSSGERGAPSRETASNPARNDQPPESGAAGAPDDDGDPSEARKDDGNARSGTANGEKGYAWDGEAEESGGERRRFAPPEAQPPESLPREESVSDEGVSESAADYLRRRGLASDAAAPADATSAPGEAMPVDDGPGRWGETVSTRPPPEADGPDGTESVPPVEADRNLLTIEELRRVRGLGAEETAGSDSADDRLPETGASRPDEPEQDENDREARDDERP